MIALKKSSQTSEAGGGEIGAWIKKIGYPPLPIALNKYVCIEGV